MVLSSQLIPDGSGHILNQMETEPFVFILGMPAIGKTSLARKLAIGIADQHPTKPVPLVVELQTLIPQINSGEICTRMDFIEA
jgi:hypothetical protein